MIPIVFIHSFNHSYLPISLWKARETNPHSEVFLLGDHWNAHFGAWVHHLHQQSFSHRAAELARRFVNFSTNPAAFELICLQRWFMLLEFMEKMNLDACLYLDSDVLLFSDVEADAQRFSSYGMTVAGISGHTNFIQKRDTLANFCDWISNAYISDQKIREADLKYKEFLKYHNAGGISDMTYFTEFREAFPETILDIGQPMEGKMYDITVTYTQGLREENGIKKLEWCDGIPIVQNPAGEKIQMQSLHFQGDSKKYMKQMAQISDSAFSLFYYLNNGLIPCEKAIRKIIPASKN